jgi:hypothetical protein
MRYRKRTRIWNNIAAWKPRPLCTRDCDSMDDNRKRHREVAQRLPPGKKNTWGDRRPIRQQELYMIPPDLVREIFEAIRTMAQARETTFLN